METELRKATSIDTKMADGEHASVTHAYWWDIDGDGSEFVCSKCGIPAGWMNPHIKKQDKSDYCPACGAPMDGKRVNKADNKLTPCPHCGRTDTLKVATEYEIEGLDEESGSGSYTVCCDFNAGGCGATGGYKPTKEKAISAWNCRIEPAISPLMTQELREINQDMNNRRWVWIEILAVDGYHQSAYYRVEHDDSRGSAFCCGYPGIGYCFLYSDYGKTWIAYARKPENNDDSGEPAEK